MNGVQPAGAFPAIQVLRLTNNQPVKSARQNAGDDVLLAAATHPPRINETRPIAALLPQVLARYGLADEAPSQTRTDEPAIDLLA